jgi:hypothetical protein
MPPRELIESLDIRLIVADGDLDGLVAGAVLKTAWPDAEVVFSHPAEIRSGYLDEIIDLNTAICDLPFHPNCGLYIDHHATNRPTAEQEIEFASKGGHIRWQEADSAARVAYDLFLPLFDLSALTPIMDMVDRLDGGKITEQEFLSDHPVVWLSRTVTSSDQEYSRSLLDKLIAGQSVADIVQESETASRIEKMRQQMQAIRKILNSKSRIENRLAICQLQETGLRTNGYLVTAHFGSECDACIIVHGSLTGKIGDTDTWPLSASFYTNSFLHKNGGMFDLSALATMFDAHGGGHQNACGCRIIPLGIDGEVELRELRDVDLDANLAGWLDAWNQGQDESNSDV